MTTPKREGLGSGRLCAWELWTIYRFSENVALSHDQFGHKKVVSTGNVSKSDRAEKNLVIRGNVTKPEKSELDPPLAEGEMDDGATFFLYTHAPPTTHAP